MKKLINNPLFFKTEHILYFEKQEIIFKLHSVFIE